jgi:hypothetical protein
MKINMKKVKLYIFNIQIGKCAFILLNAIVLRQWGNSMGKCRANYLLSTSEIASGVLWVKYLGVILEPVDILNLHVIVNMT